MSRFGTREVAASGVMAALVCVATFLITIPIPATGGYFNIGDGMIMVAALTFGPIVGGVAGGVGSALSDILSGYSYFAPFTLIVKGIEGLLAGWIISRRRNPGLSTLVPAWIIGGLEMVAGYFVVEAFVMNLGIASASAELPANFTQLAVGGIVGIPVSLALRTRVTLRRTHEPVKH